MNILYYCDEYPPARNGGIGTVVKNVAEAMVQRGHQVYVAGKYLEGEGRETIESINGVVVIRWHKGSYNTLGIRCCTICNKTKKAQRVFNRTCLLIEKTILRYNIDILEMPDYVDDFLHNDFLNLKKLCFSIPIIIRVHGGVSFLYYYLKKANAIENKIRQDRDYFRRADAICAVSVFSKQFACDFLCPETPVDVIYNPIDDESFRDLNKQNDGTEVPTILYFGKITEMKGVFSLIRAFNIVAATHPKVRLKLVGGGGTKTVKQLIDPVFSERVEFVGFLSHEKLFDEIDNASFCVLPSYFESFSMAAVEVLARCRALVFTEKATGPELIENGVNGLLVDPNNIEQLAEKMILLLEDLELRDRMARNGYEMCRRRFSTEVILPQMEQYYKRVIQKCIK